MQPAEFFFLGPYATSIIAPRLYKEIYIAWQHLPESVIKLNTNGVSHGNPGAAGAGGVFRNQSGDWVFGFSRAVRIATNSFTEAWAIRDGLCFAGQKNFHSFIVESDSKYILDLVTDTNTSDNHGLSAVICDCRVLLRHIPQNLV
ncbi:hypothetical protein ACH5RR_012220 [Cinchona calisaya]|uniref:RNase H type-1 domain-containing protein n=1 Tax=Cinchona calisaya TaxID=153742 RepID=A0ABD3A741_9GENT